MWLKFRDMMLNLGNITEVVFCKNGVFFAGYEYQCYFGTDAKDNIHLCSEEEIKVLKEYLVDGLGRMEGMINIVVPFQTPEDIKEILSE